MPTVTTRDGVSLHVQDLGQGRPVILIHGWPLSSAMWEYQLSPLLESGHRVIAYDRRGFGKSDQPAHGYDYDTFADDLAAVIEASGAQRPALVGFSMGGGEVARYLSRHGAQNVSAAVLLASIVPGVLQSDANPHGAPREQFDGMIAALRADRPKTLAGAWDLFWGKGFLTNPASSEMMDWSMSLALSASGIATAECVRAFGTTDFVADLPAFTCPTLVIHGAGDKMVPIEATADRVHTALPRAEIVKIEDAPHALFATHREEVNQALLRFLTR